MKELQSKQLNIRVTPSLRNNLQDFCQSNSTSQSKLISRLLKQHFSENGWSSQMSEGKE